MSITVQVDPQELGDLLAAVQDRRSYKGTGITATERDRLREVETRLQESFDAWQASSDFMICVEASSNSERYIRECGHREMHKITLRRANGDWRANIEVRSDQLIVATGDGGKIFEIPY